MIVRAPAGIPTATSPAAKSHAIARIVDLLGRLQRLGPRQSRPKIGRQSNGAWQVMGPQSQAAVAGAQGPIVSVSGGPRGSGLQDVGLTGDRKRHARGARGGDEVGPLGAGSISPRRSGRRSNATSAGEARRVEVGAAYSAPTLPPAA